MTSKRQGDETAMPTFDELKRAVVAAADLPDGTRRNILRAIDLVAGAMGNLGLSAHVDIAAVQRLFERLTPAMLGFKSAGALSSMKSNFRQALRCAGVPVMPGKSRTPLSPAWAKLRDAAEPHGFWPALSPFAHFCCERGVEPEGAEAEVLRRYLACVEETSIKSRAMKVEKQVTRAWTAARTKIAGWPSAELARPARKRSEETPRWTAYPASLEADAKAFVSRGSAADWLRADVKRALRPATVRNYIGALRRVAGELLACGAAPEDLRTLADLVRPDRVETVLTRVRDRTGRSSGGHVEQLAVILYIVARDHVRASDADIELLARYAKATRGAREMGKRTARKLEAMSSEQMINAIISLPDRLLELARSHKQVDLQSARLVRAALFLQLLLDTSSRQGNVVGLDLRTHLLEERDGRVFVHVPGEEVKNGEDVGAKLRPRTVAALRLYRDTYRPIHAAGAETSWLFPRSDGTHWTTTSAWRTLTELTEWHIGQSVNPHLVRALVGEIIEAEHPGAIGMVKDVLGHKRSTTTELYYRGRKEQQARRTYHAALDRRASRR